MQNTLTTETISTLAAIAAGLGLIVRELQWRASDTKPPNGNGENLLRRLIAEHERDCSNAGEIKREFAQIRSDIRALERNVSEDIRGVHERLDRVIEGRH